MASPVPRTYPFPQKKPAQKRRVFRLTKSKLPFFVFLIMLFYLTVSFTLQFNRLSVLRQEVRQVQEQVVELRSKNAELKEQLKRAQSDAYLEQTAREKLGLIKPGEARVVPVEANRQNRQE